MLFTYKEIFVDLGKKEVQNNGESVHLTLKEFQILELLIKNS
jgi:DNA-binding response OmpR family regulator